MFPACGGFNSHSRANLLVIDEPGPAPVVTSRFLSIMPTFHCTAECEHCGTLSSPRERTSLPSDAIVRAIDEAAAAGFCGIVFTGGEPTVVWNALLAGVRRARSHGLGVRLVTNGHWGTARGASQVAGSLAEAGLTELNLSSGDQHARFVPLERIVNAARAAARLGLPVSILLETAASRAAAADFLRDAVEAIRSEIPGAHLELLHWPWSTLDGFVTISARERTIDRHNLAECTGCDSVLQNYTLQADGKLSACCGLAIRGVPELSMGSRGRTTLSEAVSRAESDLLKRWIRAEGPQRILAWAAEHDAAIEWEHLYEHRCHACIRLYTDPRVRAAIAAHWKEKAAAMERGVTPEAGACATPATPETPRDFRAR